MSSLAQILGVEETDYVQTLNYTHIYIHFKISFYAWKYVIL